MTDTPRHVAGPPPGPRPYRRRAWDEPGIPPELARSRIHALVRETRGPARSHRCADCGGPARDWAYTYAEGEAWTPGAYGPPDRYRPLCPRCHVRYDMGKGRWGR